MTYSPASLTVVIVSYNSRATIGRTLSALENQTVQGFETLVVDSSDDGSEMEIILRFPWVRLHHEAERLYPGKARNVALQHARGDLIAFVDADCIADPDWVERILEAHSDPAHANRLIIGGSVGTANVEDRDGWASFFCEFSPWLRVGETRVAPDIPTCCYSMKREAFARFGPFEEEGYCSDTIFNWRAGAENQHPLFVPRIHVRHINPTDRRRILAKQGMHGERFATVRVREHGWSAMRALLHAFTAPFLPPLLWLRTARRVWRAEGYRSPFLRATLALWHVLSAWCLGEARGYWRAARPAPHSKTRRSLDHDGGNLAH